MSIFKVYMLPNYNVNKFYITLNTKYGSINTKFKVGGKEYDMPKGIAHFLEHLSFNMPDESVEAIMGAACVLDALCHYQHSG